MQIYLCKRIHLVHLNVCACIFDVVWFDMYFSRFFLPVHSFTLLSTVSILEINIHEIRRVSDQSADFFRQSCTQQQRRSKPCPSSHDPTPSRCTRFQSIKVNSRKQLKSMIMLLKGRFEANEGLKEK